MRVRQTDSYVGSFLVLCGCELVENVGEGNLFCYGGWDLGVDNTN